MRLNSMRVKFNELDATHSNSNLLTALRLITQLFRKGATESQ